jgi:hypothetical protein
MEQQKNFFGAKEFVEVIVEKNLGIGGLGYSKAVVNRVIKTILGYDFNSNCLAGTKTIKKFVFENHDVIENVIEIKNVIKNEFKVYGRRIKSAEKLRKVYNDMLSAGSPFDLRDLKINGNDIIKEYPHVNIENLDDLLDVLLLKTALNPKMNSRQELLALAGKVINSKRSYYLDND